MTFITAEAPPALQRVRDRAVLLNQVMVSGAVLLATVLVLVTGGLLHAAPLMYSLLLVFAATGVAFVVPWERSPVGLVLLLPLTDIVAILLLSLAAPNSGFPLLWTFPAMWIGSALGGLGIVAAMVTITTAYWATFALYDDRPITPNFIILPVVVAGLSTIASVVSWRSGAQRVVLEKQSRELRRAVARARQQEDLVTEVLDAVDFGVLRLTPDGETVVTNDAVGRLRLAVGDVEQSPAYAADGITRLASEDLPIARARRGEPIDHALVWTGDPGDASRRALRFTSRRVAEKDLANGAIIVVAEDVTAEQLALRAREDLIASVSHELRTPLTSITGYVDLVLENEQLPGHTRSRLEIVERNAGRLLTIVSDLLAASATSRKGIDLTLEIAETDLLTLVEASVESAMLPIAEKGITIDVRGDDSVCAPVDPHRIRQVLDNLLSNAIKYGNAAGRIDIDIRGRTDAASIVVRDDGPGIPEGDVPRLFERFYRSALVRQSVTHGSGLGLAISRDIARAHGGDLTVRTALGGGAEFTLLIPKSANREKE